MLNTENLRGGATIGAIEDGARSSRRSSPGSATCSPAAWRSAASATTIDPVDLYITIASLCYFPVSNRYTLAAVFGVDFTPETLREHALRAADIVLAWLERKT
jgi:hypothetical protein